MFQNKCILGPGIEHDNDCPPRWKQQTGEGLQNESPLMAKKISLTLPELGLIVMTRGILGIGFGLLLSSALKRRTRRAVGIALMSVGVVTTVPIVMRIRGELE